MFRLSRLFLHSGGRALLSLLAIALGVALGYAVHLINRAAVNELAAGVRSIAGEADLEVRGGRAGFPESLYATLARLPGVAVASPVLEADAAVRRIETEHPPDRPRSAARRAHPARAVRRRPGEQVGAFASRMWFLLSPRR